MILLDTNIFLEFMLGQKRSRECRTLLDSIARGNEEAIVTHFTVHAIEAIVGGGDDLVNFLRNLEASAGLQVYDTTTTEETTIALLALEKRMDFDDTLQYYVAKKAGARAIISFDKHFDGLDVPRQEPSDVIQGGSAAE